MTIMENNDNSDESTEPVLEEQKVIFRKVGGFDLLSRRPLICQNKSLYIVSHKNVRSYSTENGSFIDEFTFGNSSEIVAIQQNLANADELIVVTENGLILTWNHVENIKINESFLKLNEGTSKVKFFQQVGDVYYFVLTTKKKKKSRDGRLFYCHKNQLSNVMTVHQSDQVNSDAYQSVAFGPTSKPKYCATLYKNQLNIYQIPVKVGSKSRTHTIASEKFFTCVVCHPNDSILATGDSIGQIILWSNALDTPSKSVMHWHSQEVNDMAFSPTGTYLYSVGNEKVLVKWNLVGQFTGEKSFLPRIGAEIKFVVADPNMIVTSHDDQTLQIIDSQMNGVQAVIEGLAIGFNSRGYLSSGMNYNPRMKALAMNGRIGHVQLYSPSRQKQLFQLDITNQNLVSEINMQSLEERLNSQDKQVNKIFPIEVTKVAVSKDGKWMATVEYRNDHETLPEIRLKFWLLKENNDFSLNTTIHLPHQQEITFIAFSPLTEDLKILHLVSTSKDKSFKIWDLNIDENKSWWTCSRSASLNSHSIPRSASFSSDVSLLTVLFDHIVTLWELDSPTSIRYIPRMDIFQLRKNSDVIFLSFGAHKYSHYLIEGYNRSVMVLNILKKFEVVFSYKPESKGMQHHWTSMTFNPYENVLALFSRQGIQFLSLATQNIIMKIKFSEANFAGDIVSKVFTPEEPTNKYDGMPLSGSTFYCLNEKHELFQAMIVKNDQVYDEDVILVGTEENRKTKLYMKHIQNQLSLMLTKKSKATSDANLSPAVANVHLEQNRKALVEKFFYNVPSHVLPPVSMFEKQFLTAFQECLNISSDNV